MNTRYIFRGEIQTFMVDAENLESIVKEDNDIIKCQYVSGKEFNLYCDDAEHHKKTFDDLTRMMAEFGEHKRSA
jgi:hypothetical protein